MRLLHAKTLKFREFFDTNIPPYAILSHTWEEEEVSLQDMQSKVPTRKRGLTKIKACCKQAIDDEIEWVWVDTCCIDKASSADLSEAINSMFQWYKRAEVCYALLSDKDQRYEFFQTEKPSRWFTRGWTLQELLAPEKLVFFSKRWEFIASKLDETQLISEMTGIGTEFLSKTFPLSHATIAQRMSWASQRKTSRSEDTAYCLMGLFDVNMPLLYGEGGEKAFRRLQLEILRETTDQSLFAWIGEEGSGRRRIPPSKPCSVLARSPADFVFCNAVKRLDDSSLLTPSPHLITNMGISLQLPLRERGDGSYLALLNCKRNAQNLAIALDSDLGANTYYRIENNKLHMVNEAHIIVDSAHQEEENDWQEWERKTKMQFFKTTSIYLATSADVIRDIIYFGILRA